MGPFAYRRAADEREAIAIAAAQPGAAFVAGGTDFMQLWKAGVSAPDLVIEVISPDSKNRDRSEKLDAYRSIPSVMEYVLVDSRRVWVCVYRRMPGGVWTDAIYGIDETVDIHTVGISVPVAELYAGTGRLLSTERS